jgi:hypothetical protein
VIAPTPLAAPAVSVSGVPTHILVVDGVMLDTDGTTLTVADVVYVAIQPEPAPLLTVTVYTPVAAVVAALMCGVDVSELVTATGPLHE